MKEPKIIVVNESDGKSILSDIFSFGALLVSFWITHKFIGGSIVLQIVLAVTFFVVLSTRAQTRQMTKDEALEYLTGKE